MSPSADLPRKGNKMTKAAEIPGRWLQGRTLMLTRHEGYGYREAVHIATLQWNEQERLARKVN